MIKHSDKKIIYAALFGNSAIAVMKFIAAFISGSTAMLAEGFHSTADS
jgi:divalent metal cation (Fe/Co/Zn/Cd) transporter